VRFDLKIPNRLGKMSETQGGGIFFTDTVHYRYGIVGKGGEGKGGGNVEFQHLLLGNLTAAKR